MTTAPKKILVGVAWPYANGEKHIGQIAGAYLPPDIFARFQRMMGNDVLMVSGSDMHGTPVTLKAEAEGTTPDAVANKYHEMFIDGCLAMGLAFDLYSHTDTQNHWDVTQDMFLTHLNTGYIYKDTQEQLYDPQAGGSWPIAMWRGPVRFAGIRMRAAISATIAAGSTTRWSWAIRVPS